MAFLDIPADLLTEARGATQEGVDFIIDNLGRDCTVFYQATNIDCPNCIQNPKTHESTGRYKAGGPEPFPLGEVCPVCNGAGSLAGTAVSQTIRMLLDWEPKKWDAIWANAQDPDRILRKPGGVVWSKGYMADLPKILTATHIILDSNNNLQGNKFTLYGEPTAPGNIVQNRYFVCYWQRSQG